MSDVITADEVAELLGIGVRKVRELASTGDIPGHQFGRQWRFSRQAILNILETS